MGKLRSDDERESDSREPFDGVREDAQFGYDANDPQRFYFDGYEEESNPEDDDFDDEFDEDFIAIPDDNFFDDLGEGDEEDAVSGDSSERLEKESEDDEFDDLNSDENVYGGEDEI